MSVALLATLAVSAPAFLMLEHIPVKFAGEPVRLHEAMLALLTLARAVMAVRLTSRPAAVVALGLTGLGVAMFFALLSAPDLAMTHITVESLGVIFLALLFAHLPPSPERSRPHQRLFHALLAGMVGVLMAGLVLAVLAGEFPPTTAQFFAEASLPQAQGRHVVNVILVDFRAMDTLGEITVLAVAAVGVYALIRLRPRSG